MTKPGKSLKEELEELSETVEKHADKGLDDLRNSRWTGEIVILVMVLGVIALLTGFLLLF